jgi:hypothetical protein
MIACSDYQQFYSNLMTIVMTLFSLSGLSIFYFWQQHEDRERRIMVIKKLALPDEIALEDIENHLKDKVKNTILPSALHQDSQMMHDAYRESYIYNRDWFNTKPIPNSILVLLSFFALLLGVIVPMDLLLPDPIILRLESCESIFYIITIGTAICLIILGFAAYYKSKGDQTRHG